MSNGIDDRDDTVTQDAFRIRMEAQCSRIERYRHELMRKKGKPVSQDEAAQEWIERYAESFSRDHNATRGGVDVV